MGYQRLAIRIIIQGWKDLHSPDKNIKPRRGLIEHNKQDAKEFFFDPEDEWLGFWCEMAGIPVSLARETAREALEHTIQWTTLVGWEAAVDTPTEVLCDSDRIDE